MRRRAASRRAPPCLASVGIVLGLLAYLVPLYGAVPRSGPSGTVDRALWIVLARHRPVQAAAVADDRPTARPPMPALPPGGLPTGLVIDPAGAPVVQDAPTGSASRPSSSGTPRSPPLS